jgi:hypothetical protein
MSQRSNDLVDATEFEFIVSKAANRRSWTADFASFSIKLRIGCGRYARGRADFSHIFLTKQRKLLMQTRFSFR